MRTNEKGRMSLKSSDTHSAREQSVLWNNIKTRECVKHTLFKNMIKLINLVYTLNRFYERGNFMGKKKEEPIDLNNIKPEEKLKYEIAEELGLIDKVLLSGWKSLTSKESGRIGGLMTKRRRAEQKKENNSTAKEE